MIFKFIPFVRTLIQDYPESPMNVKVENIQKSVKVNFEPGFNNRADTETYDIEFAKVNFGLVWEVIKTIDHQGEQKSKQTVVVTKDRI